MATAENVWRGMGRISPAEPAEIPILATHSGGRLKNPAPAKKWGGFVGVVDYFFHREKKEPSEQFEHYLILSQKNPGNATFHLKLAEIYQRTGEEEKAIAQYLQSAGIFSRDQYFPQAMAIYKHILSLNPHLVQVNLKMAEIFRQTGFWADAISQYKLAIKHYERWGRREKIPEIKNLINELESQRASQEKKTQASANFIELPETKSGTNPVAAPESGAAADVPEERAFPDGKGKKNDHAFDLRAQLVSEETLELKGVNEISTDKLFGFEEIFKELQETVIPKEVYPDFNYQMGVACREMGFNDGAIEQLRMALENGQKPVESAKLLSKCFREKGWFHEAEKYFEKAVRMENKSQDHPSAITQEFAMVHS